jgi:hypothetical protein
MAVGAIGHNVPDRRPPLIRPGLGLGSPRDVLSVVASVTNPASNHRWPATRRLTARSGAEDPCCRCPLGTGHGRDAAAAAAQEDHNRSRMAASASRRRWARARALRSARRSETTTRSRLKHSAGSRAAAAAKQFVFSTPNARQLALPRCFVRSHLAAYRSYPANLPHGLPVRRLKPLILGSR